MIENQNELKVLKERNRKIERKGLGCLLWRKGFSVREEMMQVFNS